MTSFESWLQTIRDRVVGRKFYSVKVLRSMRLPTATGMIDAAVNSTQTVSGETIAELPGDFEILGEIGADGVARTDFEITLPPADQPIQPNKYGVAHYDRWAEHRAKTSTLVERKAVLERFAKSIGTSCVGSDRDPRKRAIAKANAAIANVEKELAAIDPRLAFEARLAAGQEVCALCDEAKRLKEDLNERSFNLFSIRISALELTRDGVMRLFGSSSVRAKYWRPFPPSPDRYLAFGPNGAQTDYIEGSVEQLWRYRTALLEHIEVTKRLLKECIAETSKAEKAMSRAAAA